MRPAMSLREVRNRAAQRLVIEAAFELMLERGYAATTMTAIADHAGVAERTLYNLFGSKAGLMLATLRDRAIGGEGESLMADHEHMRTLDDPIEIIDFAVETNHRVASRAVSLFKVAYQAAAVEPEVADALADLEEFRFQHQGEVLDVLREKDSSGMMSPTNSEERFLAGRGTRNGDQSNERGLGPRHVQRLASGFPSGISSRQLDGCRVDFVIDSIDACAARMHGALPDLIETESHTVFVSPSSVTASCFGLDSLILPDERPSIQPDLQHKAR